MTRHCWLDGSIGLSAAFRFRCARMRLVSRSDGYRSVRYVIRVELFGLSFQIGVGTGLEP